MAIDFIQQEDRIMARSYTFRLMPEAWDAFADDQFLCAWQMTRLDENGKNDPCLVGRPGIYTLLVMPGIATHPACSYLMYIGQTTDLRRRFYNYLVTEKKHRKRPKVYRLLSIYEDFIWFCFTEVDADRLDEYENALMNAFIPPINDENRLPAEIRSIMGAF